MLMLAVLAAWVYGELPDPGYSYSRSAMKGQRVPPTHPRLA